MLVKGATGCWLSLPMTFYEKAPGTLCGENTVMVIFSIFWVNKKETWFVCCCHCKETVTQIEDLLVKLSNLICDINMLIRSVIHYRGSGDHNQQTAVTFKVPTFSVKNVNLKRRLQYGDFFIQTHYGDVIMGAIASKITSLTIVYSAVYSDADQSGKHQSSALLAFVRGIHRGPVNSPHKCPITRKMFPFDDVIMPQRVYFLQIAGCASSHTRPPCLRQKSALAGSACPTCLTVTH